MFDTQKFGEILKLKRENKGLSKREMAIQIDVSERSYGNLETGNHSTKYRTIIKTLNYFNMTIAEFINSEDCDKDFKQDIITKINLYSDNELEYIRDLAMSKKGGIH